MKKTIHFLIMMVSVIGICVGCTNAPENETRENGAGILEIEAENLRNIRVGMLNIEMDGSLQNPAWSPDGDKILFTNWRGGYNEGPADIMVYDLESRFVRGLILDGEDNVNLPGSTWNPETNQIVFSSTRDPHDEIFLIPGDGETGDEVQITNRTGLVAYEPSLSPDGKWVVFESHVLDVEENGMIVKFAVDGSEAYIPLTDPDDDCRQPNWSPVGDLILYQRIENGQWEIFIIETNGNNPRQVTHGPGDKTDASFSPDGQWIVFSMEREDIKNANLFIISIDGVEIIRVTEGGSYDGAPSWSPDGERIAYESSPGDPDDMGTTIWVVNVPKMP